MRILEIGPGEHRLGSEWETLDCVAGPEVDHVAIWGSQPLPFGDCAFGLVYSSHTLEHVPWSLTIDALREVWRILEPRGRVELWVPDFAYLVRCYQAGKCGDDWRRLNPTGDPMLWLNGRLFTYGGPGGLADQNWHRAVFDYGSLRNCLLEAGFIGVQGLLGEERGHKHGQISMGVEAFRPPSQTRG